MNYTEREMIARKENADYCLRFADLLERMSEQEIIDALDAEPEFEAWQREQESNGKSWDPDCEDPRFDFLNERYGEKVFLLRRNSGVQRKHPAYQDCRISVYEAAE